MFNSYEKDVVWVDYKEGRGILTLTVSPKSFFHRFCYRFSLKEYRFFEEKIVKIQITEAIGMPERIIDKKEFLLACCEEETKRLLSFCSCEKEWKKLSPLFEDAQRALKKDSYTLFFDAFSEIMAILDNQEHTSKCAWAEKVIEAIADAALLLKPERG